MQISLKFVRELGYKKINKEFSDKVKLDKIKIRLNELDGEKLSAFSVANNWSSTFGLVKLNYTKSFVDWYRIYYPMVGMTKNQLDQTRVLKAYQKFRTDILEAISVDIGEHGIYAPKLELFSIQSNSKLSEQNINFCKFVNYLYAWGIICNDLQKNLNDRCMFEEVLTNLTLNSRDFFEILENK